MPPKATQFIVSSALRRDYEMMRLAARQARDNQMLEDLQDSAGWSLPADMAMTDLVPVAPALGPVTIRELLHRVVPATPIVRDRLGADNDQVLLVEQVVSLGAGPLFHAVGYSPADTADHVSATIRAVDRHPRGLDMAELFQVLFGVPLGRVEVGVGAVRADLRTARLLKIEAGTAILVREFLQYDVGRQAPLVQLHPVPAGPGQVRGTAPGRRARPAPDPGGRS